MELKCILNGMEGSNTISVFSFPHIFSAFECVTDFAISLIYIGFIYLLHLQYAVTVVIGCVPGHLLVWAAPCVGCSPRLGGS
jgi:hypothetical protein